MKRILILAAWILTIPALAQNSDTKFTSALSTYIGQAGTFLSSNKLTSTQMRKMFVDTWKDKENDADFKKALDKYFQSQYSKDLTDILSSYYSKDVNLQQLESLNNSASSDNIKRAIEGMAKCEDATYRDKLVDETLTSVAQKTGKKKKKKNLKKFKSDCPSDYRTALESYIQTAGTGKLSEDRVNAIYHTISAEDLNAYTSYLGSDAMAASRKAENGITDDLYTVQAACVSKFQSWTYKAYPSLFTKKQKQVKTRKGKGKKGKGKKTQQSNDVIIDGGILH